jgi:hypothetical protein
MLTKTIQSVWRINFIAVIAAITCSMVACAGEPTTSLSRQCSSGLDIAYKELGDAQAKGFAGTVSYVKASGLLTGAKVQQQFGKYPNCVNKVKRARYYIKQATLGKDN